jgi:propane monooxygenase reductase component
MTYYAEVSPSGERFDIAADETILDAALRAGVMLEYGCRHGNCSSCKYLLTDGDVDHAGASIYSLTEDERDNGYALMCCARPLSDVVIEARLVQDLRARPLLTPRELTAEVISVEQMTPLLWQLSLALESPLEFYPGQFVELTPPWADVRRSYSIASSPSDPQVLQFVIKRVPNGVLSGPLPQATAGARFQVRGPFGTSYLRDGTAPVLLCATGSGIAPILSILADAVMHGDPREFHFFYGARTEQDLPAVALFDRCREALGARWHYIPSLTAASNQWSGAQGRITQLVRQDISDAREWDAYLCGAPEVCDNLGTLLEAKGIRASSLFYDKFHPAG